MLWFALAAALTGAAHIVTDYRGPRALTYLFKPGTMLIIIGMLWSYPVVDEPLRWLITLGLLASLVGDCFLMLPTKPLLPGLSSFLLAHIVYVYAFAQRQAVDWVPALMLVAVLLLLWLVGLFGFMRHRAGKLLIPGAFYLGSLACMVFFAANIAFAGLAGGTVLLGGALFFLVSDSALAFNRIYKPYASAQLLILSTYYVAQYLIAASVIL